MNNDLQRFKDTYIIECFELLGDMEERLLRLDEGTADSEMLNAIFRCAHSIKGGAGAFGFKKIESFTHRLEALLDVMREGKLSPSKGLVDTLLASRDIVVQMVMAAKNDDPLPEGFGDEIAEQLKQHAGTAMDAPSATRMAAPAETSEGGLYHISMTPHADMLAHGNEPLLILRELRSLGKMTIETDMSRLPGLDAIHPEQCYLAWKLTLESTHPIARVREVFEFVEDECDLVIEAMSELKEAAAQEAPVAVKAAAEITAAASPPAPPATTSIRVDIDKVDRLINMIGEVVITQAMLNAQTRLLPQQEFAELQHGILELSQHTRELQEAVMAIRMQPVKSIFSRMPRIVRDLSQQLGKNIQLLTSGEDTEVDKTIIEQLSDPLTHMIRNSVDHGIEIPGERVAAGKPAQGTIHLSASHRGGKIIIEISDDGAGIKRDKVLNKAREKGLVDANAVLTENEIDNLIFAPGFSTAEIVSNVSGRGVGMDVVKRNIEGLGGNVSIQCQPGHGSTFTIALPLTLAILDGMIIRVGREHYIIPISNIVETLRPGREDVRAIADGNSIINVRGQFVPVRYLYRVFGISGAVTDASRALLVLVENGPDQIGLVVDELIGQQQVVIKTLEENSDHVDGVSGATILGDGKVSLILDIAYLCRTQHDALHALPLETAA